MGYFLSAVSVRNASHGCPSFPSVIYRICWNSIRAPQSFPRSKGRRAIPHGGACPPLLFRRKNRRVSRDFRCPSPSAFFPAFSFAFHSAPSCQSSFFRSASVSLRGQVAVPSWEPGGVFSCPECLSAKESGNCRNCAAYLTENKENGIKGTVFSCGENFFSMRCEKRISG